MPVLDHNRSMTINGIEFTPVEGVNYYFDYFAAVDWIKDGKYPELSVWRKLILTDLWFILYFVLDIPIANHKFVVDMCRKVMDGDRGDTVDVWARFHFKSTILTIAETLQYHLANPKHCTVILAYARPLAKKFLQSIKEVCETSEILQKCFPDVLYENPEKESPKWSLDEGIKFKGANPARPQSTVEAWGLIEGMPTGRHYERIIYDDIETDDIKDSPDMLDKVFSKFEMTYGNLGTGSDKDIVRVIGTYYSHFGPIIRIQDMIYPDTGEKIFTTRKIPGSINGKATGEPVLVDPKTWAKLKASRHFNSQQLCDPTPSSTRKLSGDMLQIVSSEDVPNDLVNFLLVDWAGDEDNTKNKGDAWAIGNIGVDPNAEDLRTADIYINDLVIDTMRESTAVDIIVNMFIRGRLEALAIEKVNSTILSLHVAGILADKYRRRVSVEDHTLIHLKPAGRKKQDFISSALEYPFLNGKVHIVDTVAKAYRERLEQELNSFPAWHDDGLNILAYFTDILDDKFWKHAIKTRKRPNRNLEPDAPTRRGFRVLTGGQSQGWMAA